MNKFGITDREKQLLFFVMSILFLVASYFLGYTKMHEKAAVIKDSNTQLNAELVKLQGMYDQQEETKRQTENYKKSIENIVKLYPVDLPQEKSIYLINEMQKTVKLDIEQITFDMNKLVKQFSEENAGANAPAGYYTDLLMRYGATYSQFKELLSYVLECKDRTTIPSIRASFDEATGFLAGNVTYRMYYLTNTGKSYEEMPETGIPLGLPNIFHTRDDFIEEFGGWIYDDEMQALYWQEEDPYSLIQQMREEGWKKNDEKVVQDLEKLLNTQ